MYLKASSNATIVSLDGFQSSSSGSSSAWPIVCALMALSPLRDATPSRPRSSGMPSQSLSSSLSRGRLSARFLSKSPLYVFIISNPFILSLTLSPTTALSACRCDQIRQGYSTRSPWPYLSHCHHGVPRFRNHL